MMLYRSAIFAIITDLRSSMAYLKSPNCSLTELSCPFPAARDLWLAPSSLAWKEAFLAKGPYPTNPPSWIAIKQGKLLTDSLYRHYDTSLISLVIIHGFWSQVWTYQESRRFFLLDNRSSNQVATMLWLSCQYQDLVKCIETVKHDLSKYALDSSQFQIVVEYCLMALNVSPRELQRFAGRLGEEEAETTHHILRKWMTGPEFKAAVWHAGQILKFARMSQPTQLREFFAIVVYQAGLTLWVYGLLSKTMRKQPLPTTIAQVREESDESNVLLDGSECAVSTAFISFGNGNPGITFGQKKKFCPLTDISTIMKIACDIFRENFGIETATLPPLLESLISLMTDLGNIDVESFYMSSSEPEI